MKALILSCNNGAGHNAAAHALQECFQSHGDECTILDGLALLSPAVSRVVSEIHTLTYCYAPGLFDRNWQRALENHELFGKRSPARMVLELARFSLGKILMAGGYDAVICTHVFPAIMLNAAKRRYRIPVRTGIVETDYGYTPGSAESGVDFHFVSDTVQVSRLLASGVPEERILITGIPVLGKTYSCTPKAEAKRALHLDPDRPHLLLMSGSMGNGPIPQLLAALNNLPGEGTQISVICGKNRRLQNRLARKYGEYSNITIHEFEADLSLIYDSADLLLSKPGGLCTTEAAVKGLPMLLFKAAGGCESSNLDFFVKKGAAKTGETVNELLDRCAELLAEPAELEKMSRTLKDCFPKNAAERICETFRNRFSESV